MSFVSNVLGPSNVVLLGWSVVELGAEESGWSVVELGLSVVELGAEESGWSVVELGVEKVVVKASS